MGIEDFFDYIKNRCGSEEEYTMEVIKARGFLLDDNLLRLSDNSHQYDEKFLDKILSKYDIGKMTDNKIIINHTEKIESIFNLEDVGGSEAFDRGYGWEIFRNRHHGYKVPIHLLEPFVARYIKAISACGINTNCACDGNHPKHNCIVVGTSSGGSRSWHSAICKKILSRYFNLHWNEECNRAAFNKENQWTTYIELNKAAEFLYTNRKIFRDTKDKAMAEISCSMIRQKTSEEIKDMFINNANKLLDEVQLN